MLCTYYITWTLYRTGHLHLRQTCLAALLLAFLLIDRLDYSLLGCLLVEHNVELSFNLEISVNI